MGFIAIIDKHNTYISLFVYLVIAVGTRLSVVNTSILVMIPASLCYDVILQSGS